MLLFQLLQKQSVLLWEIQTHKAFNKINFQLPIFNTSLFDWYRLSYSLLSPFSALFLHFSACLSLPLFLFLLSLSQVFFPTPH